MKKQFWILVLLSVTGFASVAIAEVYRTVDEEGNITFTDVPDEGAEKIDIKEPQTISNPNPAEYKPLPKKQTPREVYRGISISSPANDQAVRSNAGTVTITTKVDPRLIPSHEVVIYIDGKEIGRGTSATANNLDRGTHTASAKIINSAGKTIISSSSSTFHLLRN